LVINVESIHDARSEKYQVTDYKIKKKNKIKLKMDLNVHKSFPTVIILNYPYKPNSVF